MSGSRARDEHHHAAPQGLRWAVVTVSDSRTVHDDESGALLVTALDQAGHAVLERLIIPDDVEEIRGTVAMLARDPEIDALVLTGGTGVASRDVTIEAIEPLLGRQLPGFGELLRAMSYETVGAAAYLSRALAGTLPAPDATKALYVLPGSPEACELAVTDLILPEAGHLFAQANRGLDLDTRFRRHAHRAPAAGGAQDGDADQGEETRERR